MSRSVLYLAIAIVSEVTATMSLKASDGFKHLMPSVLVVVGYASAFYFLGLTLKSIPLGVAYAVWSGLGTALLVLLGAVVYKQSLQPTVIAGIVLIVAGVVLVNLGGGESVN